ncbi:MAG: hypothetical protein N2Z65_07525 [Clostridiales bacterium]|nr:hypothetical protein [Clostridiales bacterium]
MEKRKPDGTNMDKEIAKLARNLDQKTLATWAADCADHVLKYYKEKHQIDNRIDLAIEIARMWVRGECKVSEAREAAFSAHAAAREAGNRAACAAAHSAGHAAATAHVADHAVNAAIYAAKAAAFASDADPYAAEKERNWQFKRLLELSENPNQW